MLMFKTPEVTLQGVLARNLPLEIEPCLSPRGRVQFRGERALLVSSLTDLKARAEAFDRERVRKSTVARIQTGATLIAGGYGVIKLIDWLQRPGCFGEFYYRDHACRDCEFKADCKVEKARRQG
ncbi:MAG: hypothetical protein R3F05_16490 [Planctomycetota bacterium]